MVECRASHVSIGQLMLQFKKQEALLRRLNAQTARLRMHDAGDRFNLKAKGDMFFFSFFFSLFFFAPFCRLDTTSRPPPPAFLWGGGEGAFQLMFYSGT